MLIYVSHGGHFGAIISMKIALFFNLAGVKPVDYTLCVMRHARSDKTDEIVTY